LGTFRSLLGTFRSLLGTFRSLLGTFPLLVGHFFLTNFNTIFVTGTLSKSKAGKHKFISCLKCNKFIRSDKIDKNTLKCKSKCKEFFENASSVGASLYEFPLKQSMLGKRKTRALDEEEIKADGIPLTKESLAAITDTMTEYSYDEEAS
jgi:hypothetical protein